MIFFQRISVAFALEPFLEKNLENFPDRIFSFVAADHVRHFLRLRDFQAE